MSVEAKSHHDYTIGWICALPLERAAATAMLDQRHGSLSKPKSDKNAYTLGSIGGHNVVIACLPKGQYGIYPAVTVTTQMVNTFPSISSCLMVGIGGGVPPQVRLGDVVISAPSGKFPGVIQWDLDMAKEGTKFERTGYLDNPPSVLLAALTAMKEKHTLEGSRVAEYLLQMKENFPKMGDYLRSDSLKDVLFRPDYSHVKFSKSGIHHDEQESIVEEDSCQSCYDTMTIQRDPRDMCIHYGLIASGNQVIKDAQLRDRLCTDFNANILCVEMEAAGLMNNFPCLVIRGICDYADSHKNKAWQKHAAAVAAAVAKDFLGYVQRGDIDRENLEKDSIE